MTGFAAEWLAMREPVDHRSRSSALTDQAAGWARARVAATGLPLRIADLGAGSGSNLRFLAPRLPSPQEWLLIDDDPVLLQAAAERCRGLSAPRDPTITLRTVDLAGADLDDLLQGCDLITASALFDLVSASWCARLIKAIKRRRVGALLAVLTYDGRMNWRKPDPFDGRIAALINRHQRRDKGFGPALGPAAADDLAQAAAVAGAAVATGSSDWCLGPADDDLHAALLNDLAKAAAETDPAQAGPIADWLDRRLARTAEDRLTIGHADMLAIW